jgi:hypothetical protein
VLIVCPVIQASWSVANEAMRRGFRRRPWTSPPLTLSILDPMIPTHPRTPPKTGYTADGNTGECGSAAAIDLADRLEAQRGPGEGHGPSRRGLWDRITGRR